MLWNKLKVACAWSVPIILAAGAVPLAVDLAVDDFKPIQVHLGWLSSGVNTFYSEREFFPDERFLGGDRIVLGAGKPASLRRVPAGLAAPLYGEFILGPSEQPMTFGVVVDEPDGKPARLWVDRNGNGDPTDDPPIEWKVHRSSNPDGSDFTGYRGRAMLLIQSGGKPLEFGLQMHRMSKDNPYFKSDADFLAYWRDSARLKMTSAGLCYDDYPAASSDDALDRESIIRLSMQRAARRYGRIGSTVYVGDGVWDARACRGDAVHRRRIARLLAACPTRRLSRSNGSAEMRMT